MPKTADLLHKPHPSESKFDPPMTWISLNAGLPSQIPNLPGTEDSSVGSVSPKGATDLRDFLAELDKISRELRKGRSCCTFFLVHAYLQLSATLSTRTSHRTCFRATSWGNGKFWSNQQNHNFALLDPWFCLTPATPIQPKSDGFPCKLVSVEPEAKNSP